ncbi:hypothetical protein H0H92_015084 [Tricholoma furcatifolium]|nr:hypothetical protein H0H92_015084 [Tricholoma furcatifolium]
MDQQPGPILDNLPTSHVPNQAEGGAFVPQPNVTNVVRDEAVYRPESPSGWLPAVDLPPEQQQQTTTTYVDRPPEGPNLQVENPLPEGGQEPLAPAQGLIVRSPSPLAQRGGRSPSPVAGPSAQAAADVRRSGSRRSMFIGSAGQPIEGHTFIAGAATTGPLSTVQPHEELTTRAAAADANLSRKERGRIAKMEAEDGKRLSKIIRDEGRAEKQALGLAINELSAFQKDQANAIQASQFSNEAKVHEKRQKLQVECQKQEALFMAARAKYEGAQARLKTEDETLEEVRNKARDATERLQEKAQEVDSLRTMFAVDERERAARLASISGPRGGGGGNGGCIIG